MVVCHLNVKKSLSLLLVFIFVLICLVIQPAKGEDNNVQALQVLSYWSEDSPAIAPIQAFVNAVTDPDSERYIEPSDRIAVFDFDGTLYGERFPTYFDTCMKTWI